MKTKPKTFDAVAASRKWREDTGRMLDAMSMGERLAFLEGLRNRGTAVVETGGAAVLREEPAKYVVKASEQKMNEEGHGG